MTGRMLNAEVPDGIPQGLTVGQVARILNWGDEKVKTALTGGALPSYRITEGRGWRWIKPDDLAAFASARGLQLDWETVV